MQTQSDKLSPSRQYPDRPIVGVGAVVIVTPEEAARLGWAEPLTAPGVVLVKRRFAPLAGHWSLPGGGLEVGETLAAGVAREIAEEVGLTVTVGAILEVFDRILLDAEGRVEYHFVLIDYLCRPVAGRLCAGSDVAAVTIVEPDGLAPYALTELAETLIRKAYAHAVTR